MANHPLAMDEIAKLLANPGPPDLGPGPRASVMPRASIDRALDELFRQGNLSVQNQPLIRALVLLWHDHLDAAHVIAQDVETADGAFVHGIVHRREPDFSNARYWFHRVGNHPAFPEIARNASALLDAKTKHDLRAKLVPRGEWDAVAFIDACEQAHRHADSREDQQTLRQIQAAESRTLLEWFARPVRRT
jgi:hypothetical protein